MTMLVYFVHADPIVAPKYANALKAAGVDAELVFINRGATSGPYTRLGQSLRDPSGRILANLGHTYPPALSGHTHKVMVSFSAGYALVREVLWNQEDSEELDAVVAIDSWHGSFEADGTAADSQLGGAVAYALRAKDSECLFRIGHTDVRTPPHGHPQGYASTTQTAEEITRLAGGTGGLFSVRAYDVRKRDHDEHIAALNEWGPGFLAAALKQLKTERAAPEIIVGEPRLVDGWGVRALALARSELASGVREIPGARHSARILEYLRGCRRNGKPLGLRADEWAWCAAFAGWTMAKTREPSDARQFFQWRAAVREMWSDALKSGMARSADAVRRGEYTPQLGDQWIGTRGGPARGSGADAFAATAGKGHTGRLSLLSGLEDFATIDGNVGDTITEVKGRTVADPAFVGLISCSPHAKPRPPSLEELAAAGRLWKLADDVMAGRGIGLDALEDI